MSTAKEKVAQVNEILLKGEPGNISVDTHSDRTGYKPQAIIDAMNEVFELGDWGFEEISSEIQTITTKYGPGGLAVAKVEVWLEGVKFRPQAWGQNRVTTSDEGDARKGANTDAIKKALAYFSIGNRAYWGLLPVPVEDKANNGNRANNSRPPAQSSGQRPQQSQPAKPTTNPAPARQPQTIPNARALREKVNALQIQSKRGGVMNWPQVLAYVFADQIEAGGINIDTLVKQGDNLTADYCKIIMQFIQTVEEGRANKVS